MFDAAYEACVEVPSDRIPFEQRPWMKAAEVTDAVIAELRTGRYRQARLNHANGDPGQHRRHRADPDGPQPPTAYEPSLIRLRASGRSS
jgi:hypothetical protein